MNELKNKKEVLLTSDVSGSQWNVGVWDAWNGSCLMTYKGGLGSKSKTLTIIDGVYLMSCQIEKPLLNVWQFNRHDQIPVKVQLIN